MNEKNPSTSTDSAATHLPSIDAADAQLKRNLLPPLLIGGLLLAVVVGGGVLVVKGMLASDAAQLDPLLAIDVSDLPAAVIERGPMTATITESGEIVAEKSQVIKNELRWDAEIEEIVTEGTTVDAGELLIKFKCDELEDAIENAELSVRQGDDAHKAAVTGEELQKMTMDTKVRKAELAVLDAKNDLKKYEEAEWPQKRDDAKADIKLAQSDLKIAKHKLDSKLKINAIPEMKTPYSQNEIDADQLTVDRLKLALRRVETQASILEEYTHPRTLRDLKNAVTDADLLLLAANAEHEKQLKLARSGVELAEHQLKQRRERLEELIEDREERLVVKAKEPGLVVFETRRRPWHRPITVAVGETIRQGQQLMIIPDINTLVFKTQVYEAVQETVRDKVASGLPAAIRLDARRTQRFDGQVSKVASLPDSQNPWLSPGVKVYPTTVTFSKDVTGLGLKPGMTGDVEVTLEELADVVSAPIAAVFSDGEETFCYLVEGERARRAPIDIGLTSSTRVQILGGLKAGDPVLLVPPPGVKHHATKKKGKDDEIAPPRGGNGNGKTPTTRPAGRPKTGGGRPSGGNRGNRGSRGGGRRRG